ncbi:MAG: hypothetical protein Q9162_001940 [Coniocarpon cinnabarinum]
MTAQKPTSNVAPGNTVYIRNIHDRVKLTEVEDALRTLFEEYGKIVEIVVKPNQKARGQAFIVFDNPQSAAKSIEDIDGFEVFKKPLSCTFSKTRSDATVAREGNDAELEEHKKTRLAEKERKKAREAQEEKLKRPAPSDQPDGTQPPTRKGLKSTANAKAGVVPEEYLPPNKILYIKNLPPDYDADEELSAVFQRFPGFREVRVVPGRQGIAFVEYQNEEGAIQAKKATGGMSLAGNTISVFFQRQ